MCGNRPVAAHSRLFLPFLAYSSLVKPSSPYSSLFQHRPVYSTLFKATPAYSGLSSLSHPILAYSILSKPIPAYFKIPNLQSPIHNWKCTIVHFIPNSPNHPTGPIWYSSSNVHMYIRTSIGLSFKTRRGRPR